MPKRQPPTTQDEVFANIAALRAAKGPLQLKEQAFTRSPSSEQRRHLAGGNGGPRLDEVALKPGAALVLRTGEHLFGDRHTTDLAGVVGEDPGAVRRWRRGEGAGPGPGHTLLVRRALARRIDKLQEDLEALDGFREEMGWATAPATPPPPAPEVILAPGVKPEDAAWFLDGLARATGGRPTFVRAFLAVRCPPRGRRWSADVLLFDWSRQMLDCDRGADLAGGAVGFAAATAERPEPRLFWDDATNAWARGPDWSDDIYRPRREEATAAQGGQV